MTRSGAGGAAAARPSRPGASVAVAWFCVTVVARSRSAGCRRAARCPGSRPRRRSAGPPRRCRLAGARPARREHHRRRPAQRRRGARAARDGAPARATGAARRAKHQPRQASRGQSDKEGQERRAADGNPADRRCRRLAHDQPTPREALPWPPISQCLGQHPPARHRKRPGAQPQQQPLPDGEHGEDDGLGDGQRGPDVPGHVDEPGTAAGRRRRGRRRRRRPGPSWPAAATRRGPAVQGRRRLAARDPLAGRRRPGRGRRPALSAGPRPAGMRRPGAGRAAVAAVGTAGPRADKPHGPSGARSLDMPVLASVAGTGRAIRLIRPSSTHGPGQLRLAYLDPVGAIGRLQFDYWWDCSYPA